MPIRPTTDVIEQLRRLVLPHANSGLGDGELLGDFIERHDESALATLIQRHGPMVWGVCRRLLSHHDAEDAFQATIIILVRKAAHIYPRRMVGNWLYGVAHQTALHARRTATRKRAREVHVTEMPDAATVQQDHWPDVRSLLDQELSRLPDNFRSVIVLCDLEGRTRKEVARQLRVPEGTVAGRLARARGMLSKRLTQRGITLSGGALAVVLAKNLASASVSSVLVSSTIQAATLVGQTAATGAVSARVAALSEGVLRAMLMSKLKAAIALVMVLGFITTGTTFLTSRTSTAQNKPPAAAEKPVNTPAKAEPEIETFTAWGKEVGGLQAGLGYRSSEKRAYVHGEMVKLTVQVRNVSKETIKFKYLREFFIEGPPTVTDSEGNPFSSARVNTPGLVQVPVNVELAAGKEIEIHELKLKLRPDSEDKELLGKYPRNFVGREMLWGLGKIGVQYEQLAHADVDPVLAKLATGKLELEIKSDSPPRPKEEPFTVWGKEIGGLQAGLGFRTGEKRAYAHGETVTLVARVRNLGKEAVEFKHIWAYFVENPPTIMGPDGKRVKLPRGAAEGLQRPRSPSIAPGKEIDLYEWKFDLRPNGESSKTNHTIHGKGKFSLQCERFVGPTSGNPQDPNPELSKLATGKLELEVKSEPPKPKTDPADKPHIVE